jgi:hypothetical protein
MKKLIFCAAIVLIYNYAQANGTSNVRDFGAKGEKSELSTKFIQQAIDQCAASGGGKVYFPPGEYLSGALELKSNVSIYLEAGAVIYASLNPADYEVPEKENRYRNPVLIYADGAENITIEGKGTINGQARRIWTPIKNADGFIQEETEIARRAGVEMSQFQKVEPHTFLVFLVNCKNVTVKDVTLYESCNWTLHLQWCKQVFINRVSIFSSLTEGVNADGIDVDGCSDVIISDCFIETGDDAIVLKSTLSKGKSQPCENVTVTNCILTSTSTALKIGTETFSDFRHILFNNCVIRNSNRGLSILVRDGATVSDVKFSNITLDLNRKHFNWWGNADPIWLVVLKRSEKSKVGTIKNVTFDNISGSCQGTSRIEGFPGNPIENIRMNNLKLTLNPESLPDKRATHGFMAHDVKGLSITDFDLVWNEQSAEPRWGSAFRFENVEDLWLGKVSCRQAPGKVNPAIQLVNVKNGIAELCYAYPGTKTFFEISGNKTQNLTFRANYLENAEKATTNLREVPKHTIKK